MADVRTHYDEHLGPIYDWMAGPFETASMQSTQLFEELQLQPGDAGVAVDLGCGHGLQAMPLAKRGFRVVAIDLCTELLGKLDVRADTLPIETVRADILDFQDHTPPRVDLVVCMGDTLTHLRSLDDVKVLIGRIVSVLVPGGLFVTTFRDYVSNPLEGDTRFIPVRSDGHRSLTCFLEYLDDSVRVHDLVHERSPSGWALTVSSYEKLRLDPRWLTEIARESGLQIVLERTTRGLVTFAVKSSNEVAPGTCTE
ncbi:MAG TPA: class I SAM-dependent methyltransferase [Myxococcales bacterium]|nr:class I SAM-dependent methyltransferase [Myxococcales bacterium]